MYKYLLFYTDLAKVKVMIRDMFINLPYNQYKKAFERIFKVFGITAAHKTNQTLENVLGNPKDNTESFKYSGISEMNCKHSNKNYYESY